MIRIVLPLLTVALLLAPVLCWAAEPKAEEAKAIADIEKVAGIASSRSSTSTPCGCSSSVTFGIFGRIER